MARSRARGEVTQFQEQLIHGKRVVVCLELFQGLLQTRRGQIEIASSTRIIDSLSDLTALGQT